MGSIQEGAPAVDGDDEVSGIDRQQISKRRPERRAVQAAGGGNRQDVLQRLSYSLTDGVLLSSMVGTCTCLVCQNHEYCKL